VIRADSRAAWNGVAAAEGRKEEGEEEMKGKKRGREKRKE
jgi:hypothetical protein